MADEEDPVPHGNPEQGDKPDHGCNVERAAQEEEERRHAAGERQGQVHEDQRRGSGAPELLVEQ